MALTYDVKLIMYGENGEVEYGGDMKRAYVPTRVIEDYNKHYFSGISPSFWKSIIFWVEIYIHSRTFRK